MAFSIKNNALTKYIKNSISELKKVAWPTKRQTLNYTLLVIAISIATAIFLGGLDYLFAKLFELVV